mgnify:CR=1 FL=1
MKSWKSTIILLLLFFSGGYTMGQGSGDCIDFDGGNDVVEITDNQSFAASGLDFTVECWIKSSDGSSTNMAFVTNYGGGAQNPFFMLGFDNSNAFFWVRDASRTSSQATTSKGNVVDGTWHHLAGVRSSTGTFLYLDGVLVSTAAAQTAAVNSGSTISLMDHFNRYTAGQLDEVRIWDDARTLTELRDNMCQKLSGSESNLHSYYTMDGATTASSGVADESTNSFDGSMLNMTAGDVVVSGAHLGDESNHSYTVTTSTSLNLASAAGDDLTADVTAITSAPNSIHVYRVDEAPNVTTAPGTQTSLSPNTYYGVKVFGGTGVQYTAIYNYDGHAGIDRESDLELAKRDDNADITWSQEAAALDSGANTLTLTGQTGTEFILATAGAIVLPIDLIYFHAEVSQHESVQLIWQTASEINNDFFNVERSLDGVKWDPIKKVPGRIYSKSLLTYSFRDEKPYPGTSFYRLKQTDIDGGSSVSNIQKVYVLPYMEMQELVYPNPVNQFLTIRTFDSTLEEVHIFNSIGQEIVLNSRLKQDARGTLEIDLKHLEPGLYFLQTNESILRFIKE